MTTDQAPERITDHVVNPANDRITIEVLDEPGDGGACHKYRISWVSDTHHHTVSTVILEFQNGTISEAGVNGITHEVLLAILAHRLRGFQSGKFACDENSLALNLIEAAQDVLQRRTRDRMDRGVEGTHEI